MHRKSEIHFLVLDVDGTLTDGKIYMGVDGELFKAFDIKDGYGIAKIMPEIGIVPVVITGRKSGIVSRRCQELGIFEVYQGCHDKELTLRKILHDFSERYGREYGFGNCAYIGDDLPNLSCITAVKDAGGLVA